MGADVYIGLLFEDIEFSLSFRIELGIVSVT